MLIRFASRLMVGALLLSCGGGSGGGGGSATEFISSYCDLLAPCCAMAKLKSDGQQCRALLGGLAPASGYNPTAGQACIDELRAASAKPDYCNSDRNSASCQAAFPDGSKGTTKPGEACTQDSECAPSTEGTAKCQRLFTSGAETRKCQVQITGKEGDQPCVGTVEGNGTSYILATDLPPRAYLCRVADGLHCDWNTHACARFKPVGADCIEGSDCGPTAFCDGTRKCAARRNAGESCNGSSSSECVDSAFCQASMTCVAKLGDGAACRDDEDCKSGQCVNAKCLGDVPVNLGLSLLCGS
jgi:hypothetical protein